MRAELACEPFCALDEKSGIVKVAFAFWAINPGGELVRNFPGPILTPKRTASAWEAPQSGGRTQSCALRVCDRHAH